MLVHNKQLLHNCCWKWETYLNWYLDILDKGRSALPGVKCDGFW